MEGRTVWREGRKEGTKTSNLPRYDGRKEGWEGRNKGRKEGTKKDRRKEVRKKEGNNLPTR